VDVNDIGCEQALKRIFEFIDRELGDEDRGAVERHLHACRSCLSRMEFERALKDRLHALSRGDVPSRALDRIKALIRDF